MKKYRVYKFDKFPVRDLEHNKLIKEFEFLDNAQDFTIAYNTKEDGNGKYVIKPDDGYYVQEIEIAF